MKQKLFIFFVLVILAFLSIGYYYSDARFFKQLIEKENLQSPDAVFSYISKNFEHSGCRVVHTNATPKHLLTNHKRLWCDEGAALLATLNYYNGYDTRFVRVLNKKGVDSHTFLQVKENGIWVNYDFTFQQKYRSLEEVAGVTGIDIKEFRYHRYPRAYNKIINSNFFLKKIALRLRSVDETDIVE